MLHGRTTTALAVIAVVAFAGSVGRASLRVDHRRALSRPLHARQAPAPSTPAAAADTPALLRPVLKQYCVGCHNDRARTADLSLENIDPTDVAGNAATWEKVVRKLRSGAMPPVGMPRPDRGTYTRIVSRLEAELDRAAADRPNPGRHTAHRLNRTEYANAVRDLLGVEIDVRALLPADDAGYGFDNNADVLTFSPALLDRYLSAARAVARRAIGDPAMRPAKALYKLPEAPVLMQDDRMGEDLPFGSRGGVSLRHHFPVDGEYEVKIRLQRIRCGQGEIRGLYEPSELDVSVDGQRLRSFTLGRLFKSGNGRPVDPELVSVSLNLCDAAVPSGTTDRAVVEYDTLADAVLQLRVPVAAGLRTVTATFLKKGYEPEWVTHPRMTDFGFLRNKGGHPDVDSVEISGPYQVTGVGDTPSRRAIFTCRPRASADERRCAETILTRLARLAYRRATTPDDTRVLLTFFDEGRGEGGFESGIEAALVRMLVDPDFLFRTGRDPIGVKAGTVYRIGDVELASRLSFFLWSSIPDGELLDLAMKGRLSDATTLERQVRRMLADDRADALVANFVGQWLHLRNLRALAPDRERFPEFDENLRAAFQRETELLFASQIRGDQSVVDLLTADYTFVNERLARHYGIANVYGSHFRKVTLGPDHPRAGLLGHGSILTVTSYATRTSPVIRGKWILDNILGAPPPPPPPNIPELEENDAGGRRRSMREAMEIHRKNPACAACHARMDPLGFALENFDAVGGWRTTDSGSPIDASGALPDGTKFSGVGGLREAFLSHRDEFVATVAEKLLTYALGRGLEQYDAPAVRRIVRDAADRRHSWSSLILGVVRSTPFQMRTAAS